MAKQQGWIPNQHGAWAMLIVPFITGVVLRSRVALLEAWLLPLGVAIFTGYFGFNALTLWLKAAKTRRAPYRRPIAVYGAITAVLAATVMVLGGWPLLWWLPVAVPLAALAIWLAAQRQDRAVLSGFATVAMAVGMGLVARFTTPAELVADWPSGLGDLAIFIALFAYFFGTVWHVKALIRERGQARSRRRTMAWHLACTVLSIVSAIAGWTSIWWIVFYVLLTARTWWMTRPELTGKIKPAQIGVTEIVLSLIALIIALV